MWNLMETRENLFSARYHDLRPDVGQTSTSPLNCPIFTVSPAPGPPCSFLLLVLKEQLQELQAALLASIMDMDEYREGRSACRGPPSPLEWSDGLLLLHTCPPPLDQHLLRLLGCSVVNLLSSAPSSHLSNLSLLFLHPVL